MQVAPALLSPYHCFLLILVPAELPLFFPLAMANQACQLVLVVLAVPVAVVEVAVEPMCQIVITAVSIVVVILGAGLVLVVVGELS